MPSTSKAGLTEAERQREERILKKRIRRKYIALGYAGGFVSILLAVALAERYEPVSVFLSLLIPWQVLINILAWLETRRVGTVVGGRVSETPRAEAGGKQPLPDSREENGAPRTGFRAGDGEKPPTLPE